MNSAGKLYYNATAAVAIETRGKHDFELPQNINIQWVVERNTKLGLKHGVGDMKNAFSFRYRA